MMDLPAHMADMSIRNVDKGTWCTTWQAPPHLLTRLPGPVVRLGIVIVTEKRNHQRRNRTVRLHADAQGERLGKC